MSHADLYHDPGHGRLRHLLETHPDAAALLKTAEFEDEHALIPKTAFAWDAHDLFPIHTPEHAVLSYLYAKTAGETGKPVPAPVLEKIAEALEFYAIPVAALAPVVAKEAALTSEECLFPEQGTYPIRSAHEVKVAEQRLFEELPNLRPETRALVFSRLTKRAEEIGVALRPDAYKYAGLTLTDSKALMRSLEARVAATKVAAVKDGFTKIAAAVVKDRKALRNRAVQIKVAEAIGTLDEQGGLLGLYDKHLTDPISTVFNTTKLANGGLMDVGGVSVPLVQAAQLPPSFYGDVLGQDIIPEIAPNGVVEPDRLQQVLETLPATLKQMLGQQLVGVGVGHAG